jgi:hypothetical protein
MPTVRTSIVASIASILLGLAACGGPAKPPSRGVLEQDVDGWRFRRYQELLDVEVWVDDNPGVSHGASYADAGAERRGRLGDDDVANVVVTRYRRDEGVLRAVVVFVRRLAQDASYVVEETRLGGQRVFVVSGGGESWAIWAARRHVVKVGGRRRTSLPEALIEAYGGRYPSRIVEGQLEGPLPAAPAKAAPAAEGAPR